MLENFQVIKRKDLMTYTHSVDSLNLIKWGRWGTLLTKASLFCFIFLIELQAEPE